MHDCLEWFTYVVESRSAAQCRLFYASLWAIGLIETRELWRVLLELA